MVGSLIGKAEKRVVFPPGEQFRFLLKALTNLNLSWSQLASKMKINRRTLNDWKREKYFLPLSFFKKICRLARLGEPSNIEIRPPFWSVRKAAKVGGKITFQKYGFVGGSPEKRRQKWLEWWNKKGRFNLNEYFVAREIFRPQKNEELAEFVGIMLGDGGITKRQVIVTLNPKTDRAYSIFVKKLMERLFKIKPSMFYEKEESTVDIYISRTRLVSFCKSIGLKVGNKLKQGLDIPEWIKGNKELEISCIRGLMDTDGCFFNECHKINNKKYCYPRLSLVSYSRQLLDSVFEILQKLGFSPKIRNKRSVQLEKREDILRYFSLIGSNNPKHKGKFRAVFGGVG